MDSSKFPNFLDFEFSKVAAFDFDGVITDWTPPLSDEDKIMFPIPSRKPNKDVVKIINFLHSNGFKIVIYSARFDVSWQYSKPWGKGKHSFEIKTIQYLAVKDYLMKYKIIFDEISFCKPSADFYFDDQAINPRGPANEKVMDLLKTIVDKLDNE